MKIINTDGLPTGYVKLMEQQIRELEDDNVYHVTALIGQTPESRKLIREHWDELTVDARLQVPALNGTVAHAILNELMDKNKEAGEIPLGMKRGNSYVVGRLDLLKDIKIVEVKGKKILNMTLADHKTSSVVTFQIQKRNKEVKKEWFLQTNIYRYILMMHWKELQPDIVSFLRENNYGSAIIKAFSVADAVNIDRLQVFGYALDWKLSQSLKNTDGTYPRFPVVMEEIPILKLREVEQYIDSRLDVFTGKKPYMVTDEDLWIKPWALMRKGRKTALKLMTTDEMNEYRRNLKPGESFEFRGDSYIEHPELIRRCMYCPANSVCNRKPAVKAVLKLAKYADKLGIPRVRNYSSEQYMAKGMLIEQRGQDAEK